MFNATIAIVVIVVIIIIAIIITVFVVMKSRAETLVMNDIEIARLIASVIATQKSKGSLFDFLRTHGDASFSPIKYAQLVTLHKSGHLDNARVRAILAE